MRSAKRILKGEAAYERISSSCIGSTSVRPRTVLIMTGKKTMIDTIAILEAGLVMPNQLFMIGAKAMIGTELAAIANGMSASLTIVQRAVMRAIKMPSRLPTRKPPTADQAVAPTA